ncbi:GHKL domain-containing protein [Lederbergia sp. NSJ-179]|uniref:sensor histidine kinase n=1 Tax=Lederbergia sp. NSJ-179 TaxID=2931402 RepID=UPI001FD607B8|nr:GHKL domain-containing protein [Lederbergia sp. NSJ-179]MCJ7841100.1 GHKL domain-containing protein [Lederbergia sp. NSJ-179]
MKHYILALLILVVAMYQLFFTKEDELPGSWKGITIILQLCWFVASYWTDSPLLLIGMIMQTVALHIYQISFQAEQRKTRKMEKNYEQQTTLLNELRRQRHDLEKHLSAILHADTNRHETDSYKQEISSRFTELDKVLHSESNVVAGCLHAYYMQAKEKDVLLDYQLHQALSGLPLSEYELISMIGNILENAIDAAADLPNGKVLFTCRKQSGIFIIICQNHTLPLDDRILNRMYTSKAESSKAGNHEGVGTQEIKQIVKRRQGTLDFSLIKDQFTLKIKLPDVRKD